MERDMIPAGQAMQAFRIRVPPPGVLWLGWIIWLPFFVPPVLDLLHEGPPASLLSLSFLALAFFVAFYAWSAWRNARELSTVSASRYMENSRSRWPSIIALAGLSVIIGVLWRLCGASNTSSFIFTSAYISSSLRPTRTIQADAALLALCVLTGWLTGLSLSAILVPVFLIPVVSFVVISWVSAIVAGHELRAAQGEMARMAASAERLRISRDLHDLLGHQLSLIALKSELARRLVDSDPGKAAAEMAEVERLVRATLQEVREAVSRYRKPSLAAELHAAREILGAAGIAGKGQWDSSVLGKLPSSHEEALAWIVRESVTNVIRHSNATACSLELARGADEISLDIVDEGTEAARAGSHVPSPGSGLRGMQERVSSLGGHLHTGPTAEGGFAVSVRMPVPQRGPQ